MSLQWTLIAGFLYVEIAIVLLLVLPIANPRQWKSFFESEFLKGLQQQAGIYFLIFPSILVLFLLDSIREMRKYSNLESQEHGYAGLDHDLQDSVRLFRAQRNFYLCGFSLFLSVVIRRLVILISAEASREASMLSTEQAKNQLTEQLKTEVATLKTKIAKLEDALKLEEKDKAAVEQRAGNLTKENDDLHKKNEENDKFNK